MRAMNGWIKIHRTMLDWEWWDDAVMVKSYLAMLLMCSVKHRRWRGVPIQPGQFVTSRSTLAAHLGISQQQVRTVLRRLVETGEITVQPHAQYTIVTVINWDEYQTGGNQPENQGFEHENGAEEPKVQPASNQPATSQQPTTEERKERENNINNTPCAPVRAEEPPTCLTFEQFWDMYGKKVDREKCRRRFAKVPEKDRATIAKVLPVYVGSTPEVTYRKNPLTWLNGQCWRDEMQAQPDRHPHQQKTQPAPGQVLHDYTFEETERGSGKQDWEADNVKFE